MHTLTANGPRARWMSAGLCVMSVWILGGCASEPVTPDPLEAARTDYARYCGLCHGDDGAGYIAPRANALSNDLFLAAASDDFLRVGIRDGRPGTKMSAWGVAKGGPLSADQVDGLVALMRSWQKRTTLTLDESKLTGNAAGGETIYAENCASCHGPAGEGGSALSLNHPVFLASVSDGFLRASILQGRPGTPMPAYAETLSASEVDSLIHVIRSFSPGK